MQKQKQITARGVVRNTFFNLLTAIFAKIGGLIFTIIAARMLLPELFGIYSIALTVVLTICTFTDLGINSTLIRYLADSLKKKSKKLEVEARSRISFLFKLKIIVTAIVAIALFLLSETISVYVFNKPLLEVPLKIGALYLLLASLQGFLNSIFYALQKVKYTTISEIIFQVGRIGLVLILLYLSKTAESVFTALSFGLFLSFLFLYGIIIKKYSFLLQGEKKELDKNEKSKLLSFFGWLTISSISLVFFMHVDTFMLGMFMPAEFAGYYNSLISFVSAAVAIVSFGAVLLPVFTQLEKGRLESGFKKAVKYTLFIAVPATVLLAFFSVPAVEIIFGKAYVPDQYKTSLIITSVLLSLLIVENALTSIFSTLFQAREKPKIPSLLVLFSTISNIILNYLFLKIGLSISLEFGLIAVALATAIVRYSNLVILAILTKKELNIKSGWSMLIKPVIGSIVLIVFLLIFNLLFKTSWITVIIALVLGVIVYMGIMFLIKGITKEDINTIKSLK